MESLMLSVSSSTESQDPILHLINTVARMDRSAKFQYLCNLLGHAVQFDEHIVDITAKGWELLEDEELWKESFATLDEFKKAIGFAEVVEPILVRKTRSTHDRMINYALKIHDQWNISAEEALGDLLATKIGYTAWVALYRLSCLIDSQKAKELLKLQIQGRVSSNQGGGRGKSQRLLVVDIQAVVINLNQTMNAHVQLEVANELGHNNENMTSQPDTEIKATSPDDCQSSVRRSNGPAIMDQLKEVEEYVAGSTVSETQSNGSSGLDDEVEPQGDLLVDARQGASGALIRIQAQNITRACKCLPVAKSIGLEITELAKKTTFGEVQVLLFAMLEIGLENVCFSHLRYFASQGLGLLNSTGGMTREKLSLQLRYVARVGTNAHQMRKIKRKYWNWFRLPEREENLRSKLRHNKYQHRSSIFFSLTLEPQAIFKRFASEEAWDQFQTDGTVIIPNVFTFLTGDNEAMDLIRQEFEVYNWHYYPEGDGNSRRGWLRPMYYSLVQQLVRMDPIYYALNVAARPDLNWKLISVPYYTKDVQVGESTGFAHLDMDVNFEYQQGKKVMNMIQGSMSLNDEEEDGCTVLIKGFHRHIYSWWERVLQRGISRHTKTGNTNIKNLYQPDDQIRYGKLEPTPCPQGGIRLSRAELIHGSTSKGLRPRRLIFPWFTGIQEDGEALDMAGAETWTQISTYHRDMEVPRKQASGKAASTYGVQGNTLLPKIMLPAGCAISNALVGRVKWSDMLVQRELGILFGADDQKAVQFAQEVRSQGLKNMKHAFKSFVDLEMAAFEEVSYFTRQVNTEQGVPDADGVEMDIDSELEDFDVVADTSEN